MRNKKYFRFMLNNTDINKYNYLPADTVEKFEKKIKADIKIFDNFLDKYPLEFKRLEGYIVQVYATEKDIQKLKDEIYILEFEFDNCSIKYLKRDDFMKCKECPYYIDRNGYEGWCTSGARNVVEPNDEACQEMQDEK
ncbi:hypothetical protein [Intestinibacter sp.]